MFYTADEEGINMLWTNFKQRLQSEVEKYE